MQSFYNKSNLMVKSGEYSHNHAWMCQKQTDGGQWDDFSARRDKRLETAHERYLYLERIALG
jgi:hypothetical protein